MLLVVLFDTSTIIEVSNNTTSNMKSIISILLAIMAIANAVELDADNYGKLTAGKTVFIKFQAPW